MLLLGETSRHRHRLNPFEVHLNTLFLDQWYRNTHYLLKSTLSDALL